MSGRQVGAVVGLYVDLVQPVAVNDAIRTSTGRTYQVLTVRVQLKGRHRGRQHLTCVVTDAEPPAGVVIHHIRWYKRTRKDRP